MFLRCLAFPRKDGSQRKYLQIVQTYREKGRVRQKIVANLGRLEELIVSIPLQIDHRFRSKLSSHSAAN